MSARKCRNVIAALLLSFAEILALFTALASAAEWGTQSDITNIVAVVDCSTSMQMSDANWKVPESLYMLVDMCPDENIRLSLIVYGTASETAFRDMPLSEENHSTVKRMIKRAIMDAGYNRGQTDTGAALSVARSILEEQPGQNNMVLLFTDGAVLATNSGRTTDISRQEIDSFAVFAQNNDVVVNTLGLFSPRADEAEVARAEDELSILKDKTGGQYQRVENAGDIPDFVISLLSDTLDVLPIQLTKPQQTKIDGQNGWIYQFDIADRYTNDVTIILPDPMAAVNDVLLQTDNGQLRPISDQEGASWESYTRYNGTPGYNIIHLKNLDQQQWIGDYTLVLITNTDTAPTLSAFFLYDVDIHVLLSSDTAKVLSPINVEVYFTSGNGYRIDDPEFLKTLQVNLKIKNLSNMSAEVTQPSADLKDEGVSGVIGEKMELKTDGFRFIFTPQRVADYRMEVYASNNRFSRRITTLTLTVQDDLQIESSIVTHVPHKNSALNVRAYMVQRADHQKVTDLEFYQFCGASAVFTNLDTGAVETVEMEALEDGTGLVAAFVPHDVGTYNVVVRTNSNRETIERIGEALSFSIEDRPIQLKELAKTNYGLFASFINGYTVPAGELRFDADDIFYDPDGDSYNLQIEPVLSNSSEIVYDNMIFYQPDRAENLLLRLTAADYSDNSVSAELSVRILSTFEVIAMSVGFVLLVLTIIALVGYLIAVHISAKNELKGFVRMDVTLNGDIPARIEQEDDKGIEYCTIPLVCYYIPLENPQKVENGDEMLKPELTFIKKAAPRDIYLGRLLANYTENYRVSGYGKDDVYRCLNNLSNKLTQREKSRTEPACCLRGKSGGSVFSIKNIRSNPPDQADPVAFKVDRNDSTRKVTNTRIALRTGTRRLSVGEEGEVDVCGIQIELKYIPYSGK